MKIQHYLIAPAYIGLTLLSMTLLSSCRSISVLSQHADNAPICLKTPRLNHHSFYATGSATTLEGAKLNARQDLVQQISSDVSSSIENTKTDDDGELSQQSVSRAKSETASIPIDQHQVSQTCKSASTYYAAVTLKHSSLVEITRQRLDKEMAAATSLLDSVRNASHYRQYSSHNVLSKKYNRIFSYQQILKQYDKIPLSDETNEAITALRHFVLKSGKLILGIDIANKHLPLRNSVEMALNKAGIDYKKGRKNTVATIAIQSKQSQHRASGRHIVKINASLDVNRSDTRKLLSRYELGQVISHSTISVSIARENAQRKLAARLKQHLSTSADNIRKILGFEPYEK